MRYVIYQIAILLFALAEKVTALFNPKIKKGHAGRRKTRQELHNAAKLTAGRPVAWFHAASLGEFEQGRPVIEAFRERYPHYFILLTFFSPSGYEVRKNYEGADYICYLPVDTPWNAKRFVRAFKPKVAFFIKYEFWFNYLRSLRSSGAYVVSISAIFRPEMIFFNPFGFIHRRMLKKFHHIFVQNQESLDLLSAIGMTKSSIAGDTRFDRVAELPNVIRDLPKVDLFVNGKPCFVAGSVWDEDVKLVMQVLNANRGLKGIIAPHEINSDKIFEMKDFLKGRTTLYSELANYKDIASFDFLIIDNIGMLSSLYRYGQFAYVGGAFGAGLHNILEPAAFGIPILFGDKNFYKFQEAHDLLEMGSAVAVDGVETTKAIVKKWLEDDILRHALGKLNREYVEEGRGATEKIMEFVSALQL